MIVDRFPLCQPTILSNEGLGFTDSPYDLGGATMDGITLATFQDRFGINSSVDDLKAMTPKVRDSIYREFWVAAHCADLPAGVDLTVYDTAVNCGPHMALTLLQQATRCPVDGQWGPKTHNAARIMSPVVTVARLADARAVFYNDIVAHDEEQRANLRGWLNRVDTVRRLATRMASP